MLHCSVTVLHCSVTVLHCSVLCFIAQYCASLLSDCASLLSTVLQVHVYRLVATGTVEERIVQRAEKKLYLDQVS